MATFFVFLIVAAALKIFDLIEHYADGEAEQSALSNFSLLSDAYTIGWQEIVCMLLVADTGLCPPHCQNRRMQMTS